MSLLGLFCVLLVYQQNCVNLKKINATQAATIVTQSGTIPQAATIATMTATIATMTASIATMTATIATQAGTIATQAATISQLQPKNSTNATLEVSFLMI